MLTDAAKAVLADLARKQGVQPEARDERQALEMARAMTGAMADYSGTAPETVSARDLSVAGPEGDIRIRLYRPDAIAHPRLLVWYHGGGAMAGSIEGHDVPLRQLSEATGRVIASVDYRLAPEHVSPAAQSDCLAATRALMRQASELGCAPEDVAIGGDSIGGLFAAVTALALRDADDAMPAKLVMLYPNTDLRPDRSWPSLESQSGHVMTQDSLLYENTLFVPDAAARSEPIVSPFLAEDLSGLPETLLVTCEHDPLRDEGEAFASRLEAAGNVVRHHRMDGMIHGVLQMDGWIADAAKLRQSVATFLAGR